MNNYDVLGFDKEKELTHLYNKGFDELREQSLEDVYNVFSKKDVDVLAEVYRVLSYNKNNKELQTEVDHIYMKIKKIVENNKGFDE